MSEPENQPSELGELKRTVGEFVRRLKNIEGEMELLKEAKKDLVDEFKNQLDMKTLNAAIRAVKIKKKISQKDTFDVFVDILSDYETID